MKDKFFPEDSEEARELASMAPSQYDIHIFMSCPLCGDISWHSSFSGGDRKGCIIRQAQSNIKCVICDWVRKRHPELSAWAVNVARTAARRLIEPILEDQDDGMD